MSSPAPSSSKSPEIITTFTRTGTFASRAALIPGSASQQIKETILKRLDKWMIGGTGFADAIGGKLEFLDISIYEKDEEEVGTTGKKLQKVEARFVAELDITEDMVNGGRFLHGGCSAYLIDNCTTVPLTALDLYNGGKGSGGVSQSLNVTYHSPASLGDRLRIISTTMTIGSRAFTARCEIWNVTRNRLVSSGVHVKMEASVAKL